MASLVRCTDWSDSLGLLQPFAVPVMRSDNETSRQQKALILHLLKEGVELVVGLIVFGQAVCFRVDH